MLQSPFPLERRCPRRWSLAAACGLLSLAVLAAGVTLRAAAAPAPEPKDEPKKEQPKPDQPKAEQPKPDAPAPDLPEFPPVPNLDELLKSSPGLDPEIVKNYQKQMEMMREQMKKARELQGRAGGFGGSFPFNPAFPGGQPQDGRLGAVVEKPSDTLVEQLELPKDQGLIIRDVTPDSAAAKAGLKPHDILLELNGKPVPSDPEDFRKALDDIKPDKPVDAVVLRKGKKETVKGLSLPEAKAAAPALPGFNPGGFPALPPNFPNVPPAPPLFVPPGNAFNPAGGFGNGVITTTFRTDDHFTTRHQEGSLIITLTGKVADGKAKVGQISVQDGGESNTYESLDKVPEKYRDKVKNLVEMSEKGSVKVDVKGP